jgi:hypothetical protein
MTKLHCSLQVIRSKGLKSDTYAIEYNTIYATAAKIEARSKRQERR